MSLRRFSTEEAEREIDETDLVSDRAGRTDAPEVVFDAMRADADNAIEQLLRIAGTGRVCRAFRTDA